MGFLLIREICCCSLRVHLLKSGGLNEHPKALALTEQLGENQPCSSICKVDQISA